MNEIEDMEGLTEVDYPKTLDDVDIGSAWIDSITSEKIIIVKLDKESKRPIQVMYENKPETIWMLRLEDLRDRFLCLKADSISQKPTSLSAPKILQEAISTMADRGKTYDTNGQGAERSMQKIVSMFNALTGHNLTTAQGWKFMCCLKLARSEQGQHKDDNYLDGAAYFALAGEAASESNCQ